jgi:hypothetical protein
MSAILIIGLTLFVCSATAIWVTLRASADADRWRHALRKRSRLQDQEERIKGKPNNSGPLADRRRLDENARKLEGTTFFF